MIRAGAALLWRRQRVLWWLFGANFIVGLVGSFPLRAQLGRLDNSIAAVDSIYHQMNLSLLLEALKRPESAPVGIAAGSVVLGWCYFVFLLFAMGGVLETLYIDRTPRFSDFLRSSASFFWRMVRLAIFFGVLLVPLMAAYNGIDPLTNWIGNHSDSEQLGFWVELAITIVLALVALALRVWVDIAQLDCVAHERTVTRYSMRRALHLLRGNFWRVYGAVLAVQLLLLAVTCLLLLIWLKLPHEAVGRTFLIGQLIVLAWIGARLWQKALQTVWFHQRDLAEAAPVMVAALEAVAPAVIDAHPQP